MIDKQLSSGELVYLISCEIEKKIPDSYGWFCYGCKEKLDNSFVRFNETCMKCGGNVEARKPTLDNILATIPDIFEIFSINNFGNFFWESKERGAGTGIKWNLGKDLLDQDYNTLLFFYKIYCESSMQ